MPRKKATWKLLTIQDIAKFRANQGFRSDAQLAEALEVSPGSIAGWKKGVRAPSLRVQQQLVERINSATGPKQENPETSDLVKRLLGLANEVKDPTPLIEAARRLLEADVRK